MRHGIIISVLALLAVPAFALAINGNLIMNGGFEDPQIPFGKSYEHYGNYKDMENTPLPGWDSYSYFKGVVLFNGPIYEPKNPVPEGSQAVQIEVGGDWISQKFATVVGQRYELSFDLSAYRGYGPSTAKLKVTVNPVSEPVPSYLDLKGDSEIGYVRHILNFTANSNETTLTFKNSAEPLGVWWNYPQIDNVVVNAIADIDIKPGSFPNSVNPKSKGKIPVAILSSETFNAHEVVDQSSLTFGRTGDEQSLAFCNIGAEDVNGDGFVDLICHFYTQLTGFQCGDIVGILKGKTVEGIPIKGKNSIEVVPCK